MKQAFYNVIKNSLEATKPGGILRIRTDMDSTHVVVSFADTGGGMSAEDLSRVFEPYFTTKISGTGLGLLIVRRIVREHGGELSIQSDQGKGLTLSIRVCPISTSGFECWKRAPKNGWVSVWADTSAKKEKTFWRGFMVNLNRAQGIKGTND